MIRLNRIYGGNYHISPQKLSEKKITKIRPGISFITVLNVNQGPGKIKGVTQKKGITYPNVEVSVFKRSDKTLLWTVRSKQDGSYAFRNIAVGLECFVVGFDPEQNYNAVISDKVVAK